MDIIKAIKTEIGRRMNSDELQCNLGGLWAFENFLPFLDTLQEQEVKEQKSQDTVGRVSVEIRSNLQTDEVVRKTLIMLVNDGRISVTGAITSSDILNWLEGQKEPEVKTDEEPNKAAIEYCPDDAYPFGPMAINLEVRKAFIAGAEWKDRSLNWIRDLVKAAIKKPEEAQGILERIDRMLNKEDEK